MPIKLSSGAMDHPSRPHRPSAGKDTRTTGAIPTHAYPIVQR